MHQYLQDAPTRKAKELMELKRKTDILNRQLRYTQRNSVVRGTACENTEQMRYPKKSVYVKIDPVTMKEFDAFGSHAPTVITGTHCDVDIIDEKWFCRCDNGGSLIYKEAGDQNMRIECDSCRNVFNIEEDNPFM